MVTKASITYASEADVLNVTIFDATTAKQWREANPELKGYIRDYATDNELSACKIWETQCGFHQMSVLDSGNKDRKLLK